MEMMSPKCDNDVEVGCVYKANNPPNWFQIHLFFRIVDAGETDITMPIQSTMEFSDEF